MTDTIVQPIILRDPAPGDLGYVVHAQAKFYAKEFGFDWTFEGLIAGIVSDFIASHDAKAERCWIAETDGAIVGSVFIVRHDAETAKLRLLYVDERAQGRGLGRRLVEACIDFARQAGYRKITLWTNDCLVGACHIYETAGFKMVDEAPHESFGQSLTGQTWTLTL